MKLQELALISPFLHPVNPVPNQPQSEFWYFYLSNSSPSYFHYLQWLLPTLTTLYILCYSFITSDNAGLPSLYNIDFIN